jgi:general secretion pathway protein K
MNGRRGEHGLALASVLWTVAALSLIAAAMLSSSMNAARIGRNTWTQLQAQTAADAGVQRAILSLFDPRADRRMSTDAVGQDVVFDGMTVRVWIQDEAGKIDINYASHSLLRGLFKAAGADDADALADRVVDWRSFKPTRSLHGATAEDYRHAGYAYAPRGAPFQSVDELGLVMGMTPKLLARLAPAVTVYTHDPNFDLRVAPEDVLLTIPGMDASKAEASIAARDAPPAPAGIGNIPTANFAPTTAPAGHAYSITAEVQHDRVRAARHAVVLLSGNPAHPYWLLDWK